MKKNIYKNIYSNDKNLGELASNLRIQIMIGIVNGLDLKNKNILDVGCYDGTFLSLIKNKNNNFYGLEASDWGVQESRKKGLRVQQYFFDGEKKLPFENNFFDLVIAGEIIEHIYDTDFFLEEIFRILKPNGKLLISTPNLASLGRRLLLLFGKNPLIEVSPNEPGVAGHIRYFTFKTLQALLAKHNFKIIISRSDGVNFSNSGIIRSKFLAKIFPQIGASVICLARKK